MAWGFRPFKKLPEAADKVEAMSGFLAREAYALSGFAIFYGCLTWIFGRGLWPPEQSAFKIPWAPQSWGTLMIVFGLVTIVVSHRRLRWSKYVSLAMRTLVLVWGIFAITFLVDIFQDHDPRTYPPFGTCLLLAVLCANRVALEEQWRA